MPRLPDCLVDESPLHGRESVDAVLEDFEGHVQFVRDLLGDGGPLRGVYEVGGVDEALGGEGADAVFGGGVVAVVAAFEVDLLVLDGAPAFLLQQALFEPDEVAAGGAGASVIESRVVDLYVVAAVSEFTPWVVHASDSSRGH